MTIAVRLCPKCSTAHTLDEPRCTACGTSFPRIIKPCRFFFIHVESLLDTQSESGPDALAREMRFPSLKESIHHVFAQQAMDTRHQWRVIFYTGFSEMRRERVIEWLNQQYIWVPEAPIIMRHPLYSSHMRWTVAMVSETSAMLGANTTQDQCFLFDTTAGLKEYFQTADETYRIPYAPVTVCSSPKEVKQAFAAWK